MVDNFYLWTFIALTVVSGVVIVTALRHRHQQPHSAAGEQSPDGMPLAVVASSARRAKRWAKQQGIDQYYFVDSVDDLQQEPCFYVPVDGYDQRPDWPELYAELSARGYKRWWPTMPDPKSDPV